MEYGLKLAIENQHRDVCFFLLTLQKDSIMFASLCDSALSAAAETRYTDLVDFILQHQWIVPYSSRALMMAGRSGDMSLMNKLLVSPQIQHIELEHHQAIYDAVAQLNLDVISRLLLEYDDSQATQQLLLGCIDRLISQESSPRSEAALCRLVDRLYFPGVNSDTNQMLKLVEYILDHKLESVLSTTIVGLKLYGFMHHVINLILLMSVDPKGIQGERFEIVTNYKHVWSGVFHELLKLHVVEKLVISTSNLWIFTQIMDAWPVTTRIFYNPTAVAAIKSPVFLEDLMKHSAARGTHIPSILDNIGSLCNVSDALQIQLLVTKWLSEKHQCSFNWRFSHKTAAVLLTYQQLPYRWRMRAKKALEG